MKIQREGCLQAKDGASEEEPSWSDLSLLVSRIVKTEALLFNLLVLKGKVGNTGR